MVRTLGYSWLIRPILYVLDLMIISFLSWVFLTQTIQHILYFMLFWFVLSASFSFYKVYRFTKLIKITSLLIKQIMLFYLSILAFFYFANIKLNTNKILLFFLLFFLTLVIWRILLFFFFRKYRTVTGSNFKRVVIVGANKSTKILQEFFLNKPAYGYQFFGFFSDSKEEEKLGDIKDSFDYIKLHEIDEVYCSVKELSNSMIKKYIEFCDINLKSLKFIPDNKGLFAKNLHLNYYDITPVLSLRKIPLEDKINSLMKRTFDITFALIVICFVLSWLIPVLGLMIILESKGPIFFQQNRPGIREEGFYCYKFRSMTINTRTEESATRNDARITRIGKFIRRTSIDELPQFFNVLFGSMSVVGPRPHLWRQNEMYGTTVSKYMVRHYVKPGVTGLAQVRGYRGEIETREDIVNRTKYDIFYIENWSLLLDINIIISTVINLFKGEEKAY